jgi:hypothetical protein
MEKAPNGCNANLFLLVMILARATPTSKTQQLVEKPFPT